MAENPLESTPEHEARVRERARALWDKDGRPKGRDRDYFEQARELIAMEENSDSGQRPNPIGHPDRNDVDEAEIQSNYGEVPGRMTDQGEWRQTPMTRKERREQAAGEPQPRRRDAP